MDACAPENIGDTGVQVVAHKFFQTGGLEATEYVSMMSGPDFGPGMVRDFYTDKNPGWLVLMLYFDVPKDPGEVDLSYRWGQVLSGGELSVMRTESWDTLEEGRPRVLMTYAGGPGGKSDFWLPGKYFVEAWSPRHKCTVAKWHYEVH